MPKETTGRFEGEPTIVFQPPASESLLHPTRADAWLKVIRDDPEFKAQVRERQTVCKRLDEVMASLPSPDMDLETAVTEHILTEQQVANLYASLTSLLRNPEYQRLVFYLPFGSLPHKKWHPLSPDLGRACTQFSAMYLARWHALLAVHDVRANFVDGDVLEVESRQGDLPRVVKAAHLIPILVEKGLLSLDDVNELHRNADNEPLRQSVEETLPVLADLGFLPPQPETKHYPAEAQTTHITKKRAVWLAQEQERKSQEALSDQLAQLVLAGSFDVAILTASNMLYQRAAIDAIRKAMEQPAERSGVHTLLRAYQGMLMDLWKTQPALHAPLSKLFYHAHALDLLTDQQLHRLGLPLPNLAGPFSKNLAEMKAPLTTLKRAIVEIKRDPILARHVYPMVLVFGS